MQGKSFALPILFLCVLVFGFLLYTEQLPDKQKVFQDSFEEAAKLQEKGSTRAYLVYERALKNATTKEEEARAKLNVGTTYFNVEPARAIQILKEVHDDVSYPPAIRAAAAHHLMEWFSLSRFEPEVLNLVQKNIFAGGEKWESYNTNKESEAFTKRDAMLSFRNLAEDASDNLVSLFQAEYAIAFLYSAVEVRDNLANKEELQKYFAIVRDRIARGDRAVDENSTRRNSQYGWGYFYRAFALDNLYRAGSGVNESSVIDIDATYEKATSLRESVARYPTSFPTRLRHVLFLAHVRHNEKAQKKLGEVVARAAESTESRDAYMSTLKSFINDSQQAQSFAHLASLSSEFREAIVSLGWKQ